VKEVPFDEAAGFAGSAAGGCSGGRLGVGAEADFTGPPNVKGGTRVVVGFSASFGNTRGAPKVEDTAAESGVGVANAGMDCNGAQNSDGVAPAGFGTFDSGTSAGFGCSTAGTVSNGGSVVITAGLAWLGEADEWAKKLGIPEDADATLDAGGVLAGTVGASEVTFTVSGVGGTSDILGSAGAGVGGSGSKAAFAVSAAGGTGTGIGIGAGLLRENGSEVIGGSVAWVRSCVIVVYEV